METKGKVIPKWLSGHVDRVENIFFLGRLDRLWNRLLVAAAVQPHEKVLDVGCGSGRLTIMIAKGLTNGGKAIGVDASSHMVEECQKIDLSGLNSLSFQLGTMEKLNFPDGFFDLVVSSLAIHHVPKETKRKAFGEFHRVLKPKGRLVILDHGRPYKWWLCLLMLPMRWNIAEFQAENFRGKIPGMISSVFGNVEEKDRLMGWVRIWEAVRTD